MPNSNLTLMTLFCLVLVFPKHSRSYLKICDYFHYRDDYVLLFCFDYDDLDCFSFSELYFFNRTSDFRHVLSAVCRCVCERLCEGSAVRTGVSERVVHFFIVAYVTLKCVIHSLPRFHHLSFFLSLYLKELDSRWQKTPKIALMILQSKHKNRSGTSAELTRPFDIVQYSIY